MDKDKDKKVIKLSTKAMGLKSVLRVGDRLYMTTYGKGNTAVVEKEIYNNKIIQKQKELHFDVKDEPREYIIKNSSWAIPDIYKDKTIIPASTDKIKKDAGEDAIRRKKQLEERYFGKSFDDNIHIQLIYNIMDIRKILTVHSNNIIYMLDNMMRKDRDDRDVFGDISFRSNLTEDKYKGICDIPQLAYFGKAFYKISRNNATLKPKEEIFKVYQILGSVRQFCSHEQIEDGGKVILSEEKLFNVDAWDKAYLNLLDDYYNDAVQSVNKDFKKNNSSVNFAILQDMYPNENINKLAGQYYNFVVKKDYKDLGFSIKNLRETLLNSDNTAISALKAESYDTVRSKMYQLFDFAIVKYFQANERIGNNMLEELRKSSMRKKESEKNNDEENPIKKEIYKKYSKIVWADIGSCVLRMTKKMNGNAIRDIQHDSKGKYKDIKIETVNGSNTSYFTKLIYFISLFLSGKEINDLITTLINKFNNIQNFYDTLTIVGVDNKFVAKYKIFEKAGKLSNELKFVNGFCRMQKVLPNAQKHMYREAMELLGYDGDDIEETVERLLCLKEREGTVDKNQVIEGKENVEAIARAFGAYLPTKPREREQAVESLLKHYRAAKVVKDDGRMITKRMNVKVSNETGVRNFIANNVIESSRFQYLIRYNNPKTVRKLCENRKIIKFQISQLPKEQIERYYNSCNCTNDQKVEINDSNINAAINSLTDIVCNVKYDNIKKVKQNDRKASWNEKREKEKLQAVVGLYLTVLYLFTKNLIYVNSRYIMAFAACDRDSLLYNIETQNGNKDTKYLELTKLFINNKFINKRASDYINHDMEQVDEYTIRQFRNFVCHINAVQAAPETLKDIRNVNSYYACYHYSLQKLLLEKSRILQSNFSDKVNENKNYCKDIVKAICAPFGYNLPRFKNLSIEGLFDEKNYCKGGKNDFDD